MTATDDIIDAELDQAFLQLLQTQLGKVQDLFILSLPPADDPE
jgi:hypothetical protein